MERTSSLHDPRKIVTLSFIYFGALILLLNSWKLIQLLWTSVQTTLWGFQPAQFASTYLTRSALPRMGVGLAAILVCLMVIIGVPHLIVNAIALWRDLLKPSEGSLIERFIRRQNQVQHEYITLLSGAEAQNLNLTQNFSARDTLDEARAIVEKISKKDAGIFSSFWNRFSAPEGENLSSVLGAGVHFVFSFASFTRSAYIYTWVWNAWFGFRTFFPLFHPLLAMTVALHPEYFRVATLRTKRSTPPTKLNGGRRYFWSTFSLAFFNRKALRELWAREAFLIEGETLIWENLDSELQNSAPLKREETFKMASELWTKQFLPRTESANSCLSLSLLDQQKLACDQNQIHLTQEEAKRLVQEALKNSTQVRTSFLFKLRWLKIWLKNSIYSQVNPLKSRQVQIIQTTRTQMQNPKAMARAVRSMLAANLIDKPIELFFIFVCYAGIEDGLLRPLQPEIFGPNSWFYLSRYVFINGYIYSVIAGIFSDTWLKIQQDTMNEGNFENAPSGQDATRSFTGWFFSKAFFNSENTWWRSQVFTVGQFILPTMKATLVTALLVNLITLGRFDLDAFLANFVVLVFLPYTGFSWKLEQGFELASAWVVRDVPAHLRPHPLVQEYAQRAIAKRRIVFSIYYKIVDSVIMSFLTTFMNMNTVLFGTRSFSRILFQGFTPTELVANPLRELTASSHLPHWIVWIASKLDHFLTHDYTDGTRLK